MNKSISFFIVLVLGVFFCTPLWGETAGDYQSKISGNWGDVSTWQVYDGSTWNDAVSTPSGTSGTITIQPTHTVTIAAPVTINGAAVVVNGYLKVTAGGITAPTSSPAFTFNNASTYEHAMNAGSIPVSIWGDGSTCLITGTTTTNPSAPASGTSYYNYTWNCPGQTASLNTGWDNVTVRGDLTCTATGVPGGTIYWRLTSAATTRTITINGNVIVNGGNLTVSGSSGAAQYNTTVKGNINLSSNSKFSLCAGSGGFGTWYLEGDFSCTGSAQFFLPSNKTIGTILIFSKLNGTQNFSYTSSAANQNLNYGVMNNATVQLNSPIAVGSSSNPGYLVLTSGKFVTNATNIITLGPTSVVSGAGYVDGPLAAAVSVMTTKTVTFPLGKGGIYRPVVLTLTQDAAASTLYTAELINSSVTNVLPSTLDAVSTARYFHIVKGAGANVSTATIQLNYDINDGVNVSDKDKIRIAKDDGAGNWINLGGSGTANNTGSILSNSFGTSTLLGTLTTNDFVIAHVNPASLATIPILTTNAITYISTTFATSGGVISNDGNAAISAKGVCWNTTGAPTIMDNLTSDGTTSAPFTSSITGLTAGQPYYVRAYATNSAGTGYGNEILFTTMNTLTAPVVTTNAVTNVVNTTATGNGNITDWGGSQITDRGICWSLSNNPTIADDYNSAGAGGPGIFSVPIGGLSLGQTYYVRAYAINSTGTAYGDEVTLNTPAPMADVYKVVYKNGTVGADCDYTNLYDAFLDVPSNYTGRWYIFVRNGVYYDKVTLASNKINVVLVGENRDSTILTYDDYAGNNRVTHGVISNGTSTSYSVAIDAPDFQAQNITFRNTSNAYAPGVTSAQAVALRVNGDRQSYYNCKMLGFQDTYYTQGGIAGPDRIYNKDCYIEGSVDFIFGRDVALFDNCTIYCNRQGGVITAAATEPGYSYGYVFLNSILGSPAAGQIGADGNPMTTFYLGRPWQGAPKTVYINCYEPATVNAAGWTTMGPNPSLYTDYGCYGPGAAFRPVMPVWAGANQPCVIADTTAAKYTIANIFSKSNAGSGFSYAANWIPSKIDVDYSKFSYPLPIEISMFNSSLNDRDVVLSWETKTEVNSSKFEIERSASNNQNWVKIGDVAASGNSNSPKGYRYTDKKLNSGKYTYRLKMVDNDGSYQYSNTVETEISLPKEYAISQNYPNPFNPTTRIDYQLPFDSKVSIELFGITGEKIATIINGEISAGYYTIDVNASTLNLASGVYVYRISAVGQNNQSFVRVKKLMLTK